MNADLQQISQQKADATVRGPLPAAAEEREKAPLVGHKQRHRPAEGLSGVHTERTLPGMKTVVVTDGQVL